MALTTTGGAGILTPEQVGELVIRPLMAESVAAQVSTVIQTTSHDFRVPIVAEDPSAAWTAEGEEILTSDPTITEVTVTPSKLAGLVVVSNELAADSSPAALQVVGDGLVRDLRRKLDSAYFGNTTLNGPAGLGSLSTATVDAGPAWTDLDWAAEAQAAAEDLYAPLTAFVANSATALVLANLKDETGSNRPLLQSDPTQPTTRTIRGVPLFVSPSVEDDTVWGVSAAHSILVMRQDASVVTDTSAFFTSDRVAVRATLRVGFGYTHPAAIVKTSIAAP